MNNKYSAAMDSISLTDEAQTRILKKINMTDFSLVQIKYINKNYKKYMSVAACLLIVAAGAVSITSYVQTRNNNVLQEVPDIKEFSSANELSSEIGFDISDLENIPFSVSEKEYTSLWSDLAQISYTNENNELVYRKAIKNEDISGDYNVYTTEKNIDLNGITVTLKGNNGKYNLAIWQNSEYSYSISIAEGISESEMLSMVETAK